MFQVNSTLLAKYDSAQTDQERARISCAFFRNKTTQQMEEERISLIDEALMLTEAKTNDDGVRHFQEDVLDYMHKRGEDVSCQVLRSDIFRLRKLLGIRE